MEKLKNLTCSKCGQIVESEPYTPNKRGGAFSATSFETCLRRCDNCGVGYSNAQKPESVVKIHRNPLDNIPTEVHEGALETLSHALNQLTPIKHIYRKNQRIFGAGLANHLILLIPKFPDADEVKKIWCGKYLI